MTRGTQTAAHKIAEGLQEALAIAKGDAEPHRWHNLAPHSQQARFPSQGALEAGPVAISSLGAGPADQFNDQGKVA